MREEIIKMAKDSGLEIFGLGLDRKKFYFFVEQFFDMAQAAEREACAEVCEKLRMPSYLSISEGSVWDTGTLMCADAIRARGQE